jgi:exosome complex component RRP42
LTHWYFQTHPRTTNIQKILDNGGNVLDCLFLATRGALQNTRIPKTRVQEVAHGDYDFELLDTMEQLKGWQNVPVTVTLHRIGNRVVVDPTMMEEWSTSAKLTVAINQKGNICAIQKSGDRGFDPSSLSEMISVAKHTAKHLLLGMDTALIKEDARQAKGIKARGFT